MKKRLLVLPLLAGLALCGCDLFNKKDDEEGDTWIVEPVFTSGTKEEINAALVAINNKSVCTNKAGGDLFPTSTNINFDGNKEDYVKVANKVKVGNYTVELTWSFDNSQSTFDSLVHVDETSDICYIKYPGVGGQQGTFTWSLTKIVCGSAVSTETKSNYTAKVNAPTAIFHKTTLAALYDVEESGPYNYTVDGKTYSYDSINKNIDYENKKPTDNSYSPYWKSELLSSDGTYTDYYVEISGKVIYKAPDGDWGLLADGEHVIELFTGSARDLKDEIYPELANEYVTVKGKIQTYYGNWQLAQIVSIRKLENHSAIAEPANFAALDGATLTAGKVSKAVTGDELAANRVYKQWNSNIEMNSLRQVTGVITGDKVAGKNGRFTFEITVGSEKMEIQYDYHVDDKAGAIANALNGAYKKGDTITIKGTIRYQQTDEKAYITIDGDGGNWSLVPFATSHIVKA